MEGDGEVDERKREREKKKENKRKEGEKGEEEMKGLSRTHKIKKGDGKRDGKRDGKEKGRSTLSGIITLTVALTNFTPHAPKRSRRGRRLCLRARSKSAADSFLRKRKSFRADLMSTVSYGRK